MSPMPRRMRWGFHTHLIWPSYPVVTLREDA